MQKSAKKKEKPLQHLAVRKAAKATPGQSQEPFSYYSIRLRKNQ